MIEPGQTRPLARAAADNARRQAIVLRQAVVHLTQPLGASTYRELAQPLERVAALLEAVDRELQAELEEEPHP